MDRTPDTLPEDALGVTTPAELRGCLRDVLSLLALPALLAGKHPQQLVRILAGALEHLLALDACYVHAPVGRDAPVVTAFQVQGSPVEEASPAWAAFHGTGDAGLAADSAVETVETPIGTLRVVRVTMSYAGQAGLLFLGRRGDSFPEPSQAVVIRAAASLAGNALTTAAAMYERDEALRAKDEFLAMLGHELRNPLAPIVSIIAVLKIRSGGTLSPEHQIIERQVRHLTGLVDDLLDIAKVTRGKVELNLRDLEIFTIVAQAVEMSRPLMEQRRHELTIAVPATGLPVRADQRRLAQVLSNLLINAAKYTPDGGRIYLWARGEGAEVAIGVRDNGAGIAGDLLPRVFDMFYQVQGSRDRSGLGLGLALVKSLVALHKGRVGATSAGPGLGSEFIVRLPLASPSSSREQGPSQERPDGAPMPMARNCERILLVDDNKDAAIVLAELLGMAGHQTLVAHDAGAALEALQAFAPSIAILDIGLPGIDGYQLARMIRQQLGPAAPRLIALSGYNLHGDVQQSLRAGFETHLGKPVEPERLFAVIDSLMHHERWGG